MEDTTTPVETGAAAAAQPNTNTEAVSLGEQGAPVLRPRTAPTSTPQSQEPTEAAPAETDTEETQEPTQPADVQADDTSDIKAWAEKKGIDLENADPVKLAQMIRESERKMHEATQAAKTSLQPPELQEPIGDDRMDAVIDRTNVLELKQYVRDWFELHPEAKDLRGDLQQISSQRPWLTNMDDVYAHLLANPGNLSRVRQEGGREALTNLAQKQSNVPPTANASTGATSSQERITPDNVDSLVAQHDLNWFKQHKGDIDRAMAGTR